jgi:16S rRNA (guanine527-N7)-methyltransferase
VSRGTHREALAGLALDEPARERLEAYLDLLAAWSPRVNLTGAKTAEERVELLLAPVLPAAALVEPPLLDLGSGNGSPGLVLALLRPELPTTLLEPRARRWAFLREAARAAGRPDVVVLRQRHDQTPAPPPAGTLTLRALALPLLELAPLVRPGGSVLVFGAAPAGAAGFARQPDPTPGLHRFRRSGAGDGGST